MKVTIQAVEERKGNVERMTAALGDSVDVEVYYDKRRVSCLDSFVQMLSIPFAGYRLHLQDDVVLPERFVDYLPYVERDMVENDYDILSLFAPRRKDLRESHSEGVKQYVVFRRFLWLQAVVFSERAISGMKQFLSDRQEVGGEVSDGKSADFFVQQYLQEKKRRAYVHLPSVVQHNVYMGSTLALI